VAAGRDVFADLRNAKVFALDVAPPTGRELMPV
jgi:hypothetical protein